MAEASVSLLTVFFRRRGSREMYPDRSTILTELLGENDTRVQAIEWARRDPKMSGLADELLVALARERGIDADKGRLPAFGFADDLSTGDFRLGRVKVADNLCQPVGLADKGSSPGHTLILGRTKRGKTCLMQYIAAQGIAQGVPVLVFARDLEWRDFVASFPDVLYMNPSDLGIACLAVPDGPDGKPVMTPLEWILDIKTVFRSSVYTRDVSGNLLGRGIIDLYEENGILEGSGKWPCLSDLRRRIDSMSLGSGKRLGEARDTLLDRLDMLVTFLSGLDVVKSRDIHRLFSHSIVLDVSNLDEIPFVFLFNFLAVLLKKAFPQEDLV